jgi:hypothetical protein
MSKFSRWYTKSNKNTWTITEGYSEDFKLELEAIRQMYGTTQTALGRDKGILKDFTTSRGRQIKIKVTDFSWSGTNIDKETGNTQGPVFAFNVSIFDKSRNETQAENTRTVSQPIELPWWKRFVNAIALIFDTTVYPNSRTETVTTTRLPQRPVSGWSQIIQMPIMILFPKEYPLKPPVVYLKDMGYVARIDDVHSQHVYVDGQLCIFAGDGDWNPDKSTAATALATAIDLLVYNSDHGVR